MENEIMQRVYKEWIKEKYIFRDIDKIVIDNWKDITIYCKYDNYDLLRDEYIEKWFELSYITWYDIWLQCDMLFEYDIEFRMVSKEYKQDMIDKQEWEQYAFNCLNKKYEHKPITQENGNQETNTKGGEISLEEVSS